MISTKLVDRIAIAAMFTVSVAVPLATLTPFAANAKTGAPASTVALKVFASRHALGDDDFRQIRPGMNASEVLALIGQPYAKTRFDATKTTAWDYRYRDAWNYDADFSVIFDDTGLVVGKVSVRDVQ
ncbi:MAG TPA: outer membrane protein assembly factor BamE [Usitatibacter sp.]|nr:outer membrane protein assembly factor BamE [Usitatibacter sp.]